MISQAEMYARIYRADMGYLYLVILTGVLVLAGWRMLRWPWLRPALDRLGAWASRPHPLLLIVAGGALLRIPRLFESLWYDEVFTARIAALDLAQFPAAVLGDVHPPLWYAVTWASARVVGTSEWALRFPALVAGLLLIVCAWRLARALRLSETTALVFAALVAVLPAAIYYSVEARGYALLALLAFGALTALLEDRPWAYFAWAAPLPLTHNIGYIYLALFTLLGFWRWRVRMTRELSPAVVLGLAMVPGALWLPHMLAQSADITDGFWLQTFNAGLGLSVLTDMSVTRALYEQTAMPVLVIAIGATFAGLLVYRRWLWGDERGRVFAVFLLGAPLLLAVASIFWAPVYLTRALLPVGLGLALLWARLLVERPLARLLIPVSIGLALAGFYSPPLQRFAMRPMLQPCLDARGVYATSIPAAMFAAYYMPNAELRLWAEAGDLNQTLQRGAREAMALQDGTPGELPDPACLIMLDTPQTRDAERAHVAEVTTAARFAHEYEINQFYAVRVYGLRQMHRMEQSPGSR